jgi:uroporphyrinogen decarboxylase
MANPKSEEVEMTPREVISANIEWNDPERIGFSFTGVEGWRNDFTGAGCNHGLQEKRWEEGDFEFYTDIWGNVWYRLKHLSKGGEVYKPVLEDWADLDNLELPDLDNPAYFEGARQLGASDTDLFRVGWLPGWPFAVCRYMRKMEIYFVDLLAERERIDVLHDRVTTLLEGVIARYGEAGMDGVMFCEDLGIQDRLLMSPAMWRDVFRPLYERLTSKAHEYGVKVIQHSCGYNYELVDDLCEAGIDCLQFDQPAVYDMPALAEKLRGHRVGLFAPCDIQLVLPTGDRAHIEAETERMVDIFRGGLIAKNYGDLHGIGVEPEWDGWAYDTFVRAGCEEKVEV